MEELSKLWIYYSIFLEIVMEMCEVVLLTPIDWQWFVDSWSTVDESTVVSWKFELSDQSTTMSVILH